MQTRSEGNTRADVVEFEPNLKGDDYVIGDVHGNRECFEKVLKKLGEHDRLFIVGDLVDRGSDNAGVISLIMQRQTQIFCVRGNHEDMWLAALDQLEKKIDDFDGSDDDVVDKFIARIENREAEEFGLDAGWDRIWLHVINGGGWLVDLFKTELNSGFIMQGEKVGYHPDSQIGKIKQFMMALPYIIYVSEDLEQGRLAFKIVHADMPFNENELLRRLEDSALLLSPDEVSYAIWARDRTYAPEAEVPIKTPTQSPDSSITYVGHSIIAAIDMAVREGTNTVDTDVGSFLHDIALLVNHTKRHARIVGNAGRNSKLFNKVEQKVNKHLNIQLEKELMLAASHGQEKKIQQLLKAGAKLDKVIYVVKADAEIDTLTILATNGQTMRLKHILDCGADPAANSAMAFLEAVFSGNLEMVKVFVEYKRDIVDVVGLRGYTALHFAVKGGHVDVVKFLLDSGASVSPPVAAGNNNNPDADKLVTMLTTDKEIIALLNNALAREKSENTATVSQAGAATFSRKGNKKQVANDSKISSTSSNKNKA